MEYLEFEPPASIRSVVRCIWTLSASAGGASAASDPALPDGSPELIFSLGDPMVGHAHRGQAAPQPRALLVGQITGPFSVTATGRVDIIAARLEPHGGWLFTNDMSRLTDRWVELLSHGALQPEELLTALAGTGNAGARCDIIVGALERVVAARPAPDPRVVRAVGRIRTTDGTVPVAELAEECGATERHLQRLFATHVGISPKLLCRIRRFQRVFAAWRDDPGNWAAVAVRCGYFDQAHLVRDFNAFAGRAPAGLIAALPEFTRLFTALGRDGPA